MPENVAGKHILPNYSKQEILEELDRILSSDLFSRSSVLSNFLKFIVEETLASRTDSLKEYIIAVNGLGKSANFNPQTNATIRINAGRLRRLLHTYYLEAGMTDPIKIEVIKGSYVPVFRSHIITSKADIQGKSDSPSNTKANTYSRSKLTLAILPFRNLLPSDEYQFFVDGFGEELTRIFSNSEEIAVVAHFSTLKYATHIEDIRIVGADLGVHYVIVGSVKRSATKIRVNVGLVETMNGMQIWSKDYSHDLQKDKTIDIQDQINDDVFALLSGQYGLIINDTVRLVGGEMKQDLQTFDAILWFNLTQITHSEADCILCRKALEKALLKDPNNVMCLIILGDLNLFTYSLGYKTVEDPIAEALKLLDKALSIAPASQFGNITRGWANVYLGKKNEAIEALDYSMQLGPLSPSIKSTLGFAYNCIGEYKRGLVLLKEALNLNPYCPWWCYLGFYFAYYQNGEYEEALHYTQKMKASEDVYIIPLLIAAAKGQLGLILDSKPEVALLNEKFPEILANLKLYLSSFLLDETLVDNIIFSAKKTGVNIT
ncbi:tetratricopeptide repeat protein [Bizionia arctica]|uniref:Tetratricopeptide repeat protein n=1 Tax=Bizionia arctica TaxID=1495645 RepID=A0A917GIX2_9FLAO|nr:hypothetical protein [Bizionia arctica]GGG47244.1 hypothetical protein GCM10010976_18350 [Bizionia arctica]